MKSRRGKQSKRKLPFLSRDAADLRPIVLSRKANRAIEPGKINMRFGWLRANFGGALDVQISSFDHARVSFATRIGPLFSIPVYVHQKPVAAGELSWRNLIEGVRQQFLERKRGRPTQKYYAQQTRRQKREHCAVLKRQDESDLGSNGNLFSRIGHSLVRGFSQPAARSMVPRDKHNTKCPRSEHARKTAASFADR
jgi:hypothetical protein